MRGARPPPAPPSPASPGSPGKSTTSPRPPDGLHFPQELWRCAKPLAFPVCNYLLVLRNGFITAARIVIWLLFYQALWVWFIQPDLEGYCKVVSIWATYLAFLCRLQKVMGSSSNHPFKMDYPSKKDPRKPYGSWHRNTCLSTLNEKGADEGLVQITSGEALNFRKIRWMLFSETAHFMTEHSGCLHALNSSAVSAALSGRWDAFP